MLDAGRAAARPPRACGPLAHRVPIQGLYVPDDEARFALLEAATSEDVARTDAAHQLGFHRGDAALSI